MVTRRSLKKRSAARVSCEFFSAENLHRRSYASFSPSRAIDSPAHDSPDSAGLIRRALPLRAQRPRSIVAVTHGDGPADNVYNALLAIDDQIRPRLADKRYVLIKPNCVAVNNQLGSTHADTLHAVLDYLEPRFRGPIVIADSSKDCTWDAYENFGYQGVIAAASVPAHHARRPERRTGFVPQQIVDRNSHLVTVKLAKRLFDPDAFILGCAILKAHDNVVATLSVKNLVMAAPLHNPRGEKPSGTTSTLITPAIATSR